MTLQDFITETNYNLKGTDDDAPTIGDDDWKYWVVIANKKKAEMYRDVKQNWASAFVKATNVGIVAAGSVDTLVFNLPTNFLAPSDQAHVKRLDGSYDHIDVVKPQERDYTAKQLYVAGINPPKMYWSVNIVTGDQDIGGTMYLPGYYEPTDIDTTNAAAVIPVDDPHWLSMAVAAFIAENDIEYEDKFDDLQGQANILYRNMARTNRRGSHGRGRVSAYNVKRIRGF